MIFFLKDLETREWSRYQFSVKKKKNGNVGGISELAESCSKLVGFLKKKEKV